MIKKTIKILFTTLFFITKKIFIRENRIPNKLMDTFANKLHSSFVFTSFILLYLLWFDIVINSLSLNTILYVMLFLQLVIIVRYFNQKLLEKKELQIKIVKNIGKLSLVIFIANWVFLSFGFAFAFIIVFILNYLFYIFIIKQIEKQKEQEEFKKQFGEGNFSKDDIVKKHIFNLFEKDLAVSELTKGEIKKQYRQMAKKYHPDVYKGSETDKFSSVNLSYQFLIDLIK